MSEQLKANLELDYKVIGKRVKMDGVNSPVLSGGSRANPVRYSLRYTYTGVGIFVPDFFASRGYNISTDRNSFNPAPSNYSIAVLDQNNIIINERTTDLLTKSVNSFANFDRGTIMAYNDFYTFDIEYYRSSASNVNVVLVGVEYLLK